MGAGVGVPGAVAGPCTLGSRPARPRVGPGRCRIRSRGRGRTHPV